MNLADLDDERRARLLAGAKPLKLARNAMTYAPGDRPDWVYFVRSGRIKIVRSNAAGAEIIVGIRTAGDIFGELAWLPNSGERPRKTSAVAIEPSIVDSVAVDEFAAFLRADAQVARAFARGATQQLAATEQELTELTGKSVGGRLIDVLGRLASSHGVEEPDGTLRIGMNLTHKDLADLIGTSRETLTKELAVLVDVGLLRVAHKTVTLVQPKAFPYVRARRREPG
ncbi:MAG: Crp/Fnr family transcriptional regulator [Candidatus Velthaea sp.]|jgi:CRP-like cAMP-binding protein